MSRTIILHYHLFKNAGTSLDRILQKNFGDKWVTNEFPAHDSDNSALVRQWIIDNPNAIAFSTHTALGPTPVIEGVNIVTVMILRDPIARIRSAYRFERKQVSDSWGAQLAKEHDFEGYVTARLERLNDRQCRNFHTSRLSQMVPGDDPELDRAYAAAQSISILGRVENFDAMGDKFKAALADVYPAFEWQSVVANTTNKDDKRPEMAETVEFSEMLEAANQDDFALLDKLFL